MSRINFEPIRKDRPELSAVWSSLESWISQHPEATYLEPNRLTYDIPDLPVDKLVMALWWLSLTGNLRMAYKVRDPEGSLTNQNFYKYSEIPHRVEDRLHHDYFDVDPTNIAPVFFIPEQRAEK